MSQSPTNDQDYAEQLGQALAKRDPDVLREFLVGSALRFGDEAQAQQLRDQPPHEIEMLMHRMTIARPDLAAFHGESEAWIRDHAGQLPRPPGVSRQIGAPKPRPRKRK